MQKGAIDAVFPDMDAKILEVLTCHFDTWDDLLRAKRSEIKEALWGVAANKATAIDNGLKEARKRFFIDIDDLLREIHDADGCPVVNEERLDELVKMIIKVGDTPKARDILRQVIERTHTDAWSRGYDDGYYDGQL